MASWLGEGSVSLLLARYTFWQGNGLGTFVSPAIMKPCARFSVYYRNKYVLAKYDQMWRSLAVRMLYRETAQGASDVSAIPNGLCQ